MPVSLYISVLIDGKIEHGSFEIGLDGISTVGEVFEQADTEELKGRRFFKALLGWRQRRAVTVLHNGRRLRIPKQLRSKVADGDEISLLTPMVGG